MSTISFDEYCSDFFDLDTALMSDEQRKECYAAYSKMLSKPERKPLNEKTIWARNVAKRFGGKALTGTKKQKDWAEKIRAEILASLEATSALRSAQDLASITEAKFWIENRNKTYHEFAELINKKMGI